jgi:hypothetical protein
VVLCKRANLEPTHDATIATPINESHIPRLGQRAIRTLEGAISPGSPASRAQTAFALGFARSGLIAGATACKFRADTARLPASRVRFVNERS